jgi:Rad3-related DNA helicase
MTPEEAKSCLSKYKEKPFREFQKEATQFIVDSDKKFCFLEAPTGSGKSLIAMAAGLIQGGVTYAVHTKILQNQITEDFPEAHSLFGRANYPCLVGEGITCDECFHTKSTPCRDKENCPYDMQKVKVLGSKLRILNYDYLLTEINYVGRFSKWQVGGPVDGFNIIDEGDNLEGTLINFVTLSFTPYALTKLGLIGYAQTLKKTSQNEDALMNQWQCFAATAKIRAESILRQLESQIKNGENLFGEISTEAMKAMKEHTRVKRLLEKIMLFMDNMDKTWVLDDSTDDKLTFRPLWINEALAEEFLWRHSSRWVLMSASFLPIHIEAKRLGIPMDQVDYKLLPSTFPVERRPIYIESTANLTGKTMDVEVPKLCERIKEIVNDHPKVKGLIHGVSYKLSRTIMDLVDNPRLIIHASHNRQDVLEEFMESDKPLVLVSPSMERGVSFQADYCRFIIVAKAPFLYLGDKIVAKRVFSSKIGKEWYAATMLTTVLQATGRGMRSADDFCENYILDEQFKRVFHQKMSYLPAWWKEAIAW